MRHYEIVALVHPNQSDYIKDTASRYTKLVEDSGGKVHRFEDWGRRKLAYPIQKLYKAGYFLINIECEPSVKDEIEHAFRFNDSIVRSLFIRKDKAVTEQSPIMKQILQQEEEQREADAQAAAELERLKRKEAEDNAAKAKAQAEAKAESEARAKAESETAKIENDESDPVSSQATDSSEEQELKQAEADDESDDAAEQQSDENDSEAEASQGNEEDKTS